MSLLLRRVSAPIRWKSRTAWCPVCCISISTAPAAGKGGCAVNCRYCFRRHFPYAENQGNKRNWQVALDYIAAHPELDEIIFPAAIR
jgi:sulfatase maturation enzyme AslB (radical SAM superfamily)